MLEVFPTESPFVTHTSAQMFKLRPDTSPDLCRRPHTCRNRSILFKEHLRTEDIQRSDKQKHKFRCIC